MWPATERRPAPLDIRGGQLHVGDRGRRRRRRAARANGYLIQQFLSENANRRTDAYGGSIENRIRFAVEVAAAVTQEIGAARTAIRISPGGTFNDIVEGDTRALYQALIPELARQGLAYLHIVQPGNQPGDDALLR